MEVADYRALAAEPAGRGRRRTLYLGNPPYVRHHQIAPAWKEWLTLTARAHGLEASQLAGLHVHFFLATAARARTGDRRRLHHLVRVAGHELRTARARAAARAAWAARRPHPGAHRHAVRGRGRHRGDHLLPDRRGHPRRCACGGCATSASSRRSAAASRSDAERLREARRWSRLTRAPRAVRPRVTSPLGEICRVHRGAVTGRNATWVVRPGDTDLPARGPLPRDHPRPGDLRGRHGRSPAPRSTCAWWSTCRPTSTCSRARSCGASGASSAGARRVGAHEGYIARARRAWWSVGLRAPAPILATYMARRPPAFTRNLAEARHINIAHGLYPRLELPEAAVERLVGRAARHRDGGRRPHLRRRPHQVRAPRDGARPGPRPRACCSPASIDRGRRLRAAAALGPRGDRGRHRPGGRELPPRRGSRSRATYLRARSTSTTWRWRS